MFSQISCEFERIEFAEAAVKRIRETVSGPKKIRISHNRNRFRQLEDKQIPPLNGEAFVLLPTAVTSYNYITGQISRPVCSCQFKEPALTESVTLNITFDSSYSTAVKQLILSSGGYSIRTASPGI